MEKIKESAILYRGKIYTWKRHSDCIRKAVKYSSQTPITCLQGFIDFKWKFYTREEAGKLVLENWQIKKLKYSDTELFSEDLS